MEWDGTQWVRVQKDLAPVETQTEFTGEYSDRYYPDQFTDKFVFKDEAFGIEIPMSIGLTSDLPVNEANTEELGKFFFAREFLHACYYRFTVIMENTVDYEGYLDLIKQGQGHVQIDFFDEITGEHKQGLFDPRNGVSRTLTGNEQMPLNMNPLDFTYDRHFYITINKSGQLILVSELDKDLVRDLNEGEIKNQGKNPRYVYSYKVFSDFGTAIKYWAMLTPEHFEQGGVEDINSSKAKFYDEALIDLFMPWIIKTDPWKDDQIPFMSVELSSQ